MPPVGKPDNDELSGGSRKKNLTGHLHRYRSEAGGIFAKPLEVTCKDTQANSLRERKTAPP